MTGWVKPVRTHGFDQWIGWITTDAGTELFRTTRWSEQQARAEVHRRLAQLRAAR